MSADRETPEAISARQSDETAPELTLGPALRGSNLNFLCARAVSPFEIEFLAPCLKETAGINFDGCNPSKGEKPCSGK
jgi:hypothetical protein